MFGTAFLPNPEWIENFKKSAKEKFFSLPESQKKVRYQVKVLDIIDAFANVAKQNENDEEIKNQINTLAQWGGWLDLENLSQIIENNNGDIEGICADIEDCLEYEERWSQVEQKVTGEPSESELEDTQMWVESSPFKGSHKQVKWAEDIALKHLREIAKAQKEDKEVPTSAKWWIENRDNIKF